EGVQLPDRPAHGVLTVGPVDLYVEQLLRLLSRAGGRMLPTARLHYPRPVPDILVATDAQWLLDELASVLSGNDTTVTGLGRGADVTPAVAERAPDLVILDLQIGNMGGMAAALDLRLEEGAVRLPRVRILMLLG